MKELGLYIFGLLLGFFAGSYSMWIVMRKPRQIIRMTAEEATNLIDCDQAVKDLKKELKLK